MMDQIPTAPRLSVSVSPHIKDPETTAHIIWTVNAALAPAAVMGAFYFGLKAVLAMALCIGTAVLCEYLFQKLLKRKITVSDGSAVLTGLLLAFNLPPAAPFYVPVLGAIVAILLTKQLFGGLGFNIFNPALMGRVFLLITFPKILTTWSAPSAAFTGLDAQTFATIDAHTCATPLNILKMDGVGKLIEQFGSASNMYFQLLIGHRGGCIGETCIAVLLVGALFLLWKKYITWHIPVAFLGTAAIIAWVFGGRGALFTGDPLLHLLSGGIILGSFFMATDYVTSPSSRAGQLLFGAGCGFLTMLIRLKGGYPEGVMFSILIMNCFAPLIDRGFRPRLFGSIKGKKK
jgi:electron transport complex protein RnfD